MHLRRNLSVRFLAGKNWKMRSVSSKISKRIFFFQLLSRKKQKERRETWRIFSFWLWREKIEQERKVDGRTMEKKIWAWILKIDKLEKISRKMSHGKNRYQITMNSSFKTWQLHGPFLHETNAVTTRNPRTSIYTISRTKPWIKL